MRLNKRTAGCGVWLPVVLAALLPAGAVASTASVTVPVTATFVTPTCTLSSSTSTLSLGTLTAGASGNTGSFRLSLSCNGTVNSRIYARIPSGSSSGSLTGTDKVRMSVNNSIPAYPATVQLLSNGAAIRLDGNSSAGTFCSGSSTSRDCTLTARYDVPGNTTAGSARASVAFTVAYF
ncbi:hypothetical protein [Citrobacter meridianamericanus]|uniref:Fimbrial protein n=1 Tax=Citrobacter meridianamericanus TaxID=2894201 RepID=A0ABT1BES0_9ENTR|nr:hypothetical protein [Citrobacter meridianamericanus]MCO5784257.1 hypothetical protein [Citrobacter meridianamericanus]